MHDGLIVVIMCSFKNRKKIFLYIFIILCCLSKTTLQAQNDVVHAYKPFIFSNIGPSGTPFPSHVRNDVVSTRFNVKVSDVDVAAIRYDNTINGNQYNMDVARFASSSRTPKIEISVIGESEINSVTIHPVRFYPQESLTISSDRRKLTFKMAENLPYAIVIINGNDPQDASGTNPQLTLINDPLEDPEKKPSLNVPNVLNFKTFSENYLRKIQLRIQSDRCVVLPAVLRMPA